MSTEKKLQQLAISHAYWAKKRRDLKQESSHLVCSLKEGGSCIELAWELFVGPDNTNYGHDDYFESYDEIFDGLPACQNCRKIRSNKSAIMYAGKRLGIIHSAITRLGSKLSSAGRSV